MRGARQRELGVRFALGATRTAIARVVLTEAALTAGGGMMVGVALAIALVRVAADALLGVPSLDGRSVAIVAISGFVIAMGGAMGPARRAARVNAADLLRSC